MARKMETARECGWSIRRFATANRRRAWSFLAAEKLAIARIARRCRRAGTGSGHARHGRRGNRRHPRHRRTPACPAGSRHGAGPVAATSTWLPLAAWMRFIYRVPVSAIHLRAMKKSRAWVLRQIGDLAAYARPRFPFVSIGAQDASRSAPSFLARCARTARQAGADRFRLADTVGVWNPFQTHAAILSLRAAVPELALGFHGHNDLGMATANTLAAVLAGAASVDVTVNGLGERAGNAPLEEVVMALRLTLNKTCGIDTRRFGDLSALVARASGRPLPIDKTDHRRGRLSPRVGHPRARAAGRPANL